MKTGNRTLRGTFRLCAAGAGVTAVLLLAALFLLTRDGWAVACGAALAAGPLVWAAVFLRRVEREISRGTDELCRTLDAMLDRAERPGDAPAAETVFARIHHRLERVYSAMQNDRRTLAEQKANLQGLLSDISHQTKTSVANLKMIDDTLLERPVPEPQRREFLLAMKSQLDKLEFLMQAMVKTSRMETGMIAPVPRRASVADTVVAALNGVLAPLEQKGLTLTVDCPEDLTAWHDTRWTAEALFNLLDNAVKYTPSGGSVRVSARNWGSYLRVDVADSGPGIPESEQAAVFRRFYRGQATREAEGVGLGLYLARQIVMRQGGYIALDSAEGRGAVFSVFLPQNGPA